jgi:signal transduction histidine kinase
MKQYPAILCRHSKFYILLFTLLIILLGSCTQQKDKLHNNLKKQFHNIDSLIIRGKGDSAISLLHKLRNQIPISDPLLTAYYRLMAEHSAYKPALMSLYADTALAFFGESEIKQYPDEYFQTLLTKGDACLKAGNYIDALTYFFQGKNVLIAGNCDNGNLSGKIGGIYYEQKSYRLAARYLADSYKRLLACNESLTVQRLFFMEQASLDNTGLAYEKAGMPDSANYYYLKDLDLITKEASKNLDEKHNVNAAMAVVCDNLGGLNLKQNNLKQAEVYLDKCIAANKDNIPEANITPLLKLSELYLKLGNTTKAKLAFYQSNNLINKLSTQNLELTTKWDKLYAQYLYTVGKPDSAYQYLSTYFQLKEKWDSTLVGLYKLDIEKELTAIQQRQALKELKQDNRRKRIYLVGFTIFIIFSVGIILMINEILKRTKQSRKEVTQHNTQLQLTLAELERVNKNYIRIMRVMAHDLRNPISGITGLASMLISEDEFSEDNKNMLRLIETTGIHSMEMINELLKSGLADEQEKLVKQRIDLTALLYDSVELLQFRAMEKQQHIIFDYNGEPVFAEVNHEKIWRVINNLIVNAIKFSHENGIIKVGITTEKSIIRI